MGKFDLARESLEKGETSIHTCVCDIDTRNKWKSQAEKLLTEMDNLEGKSRVQKEIN